MRYIARGAEGVARLVLRGRCEICRTGKNYCARREARAILASLLPIQLVNDSTGGEEQDECRARAPHSVVEWARWAPSDATDRIARVDVEVRPRGLLLQDANAVGEEHVGDAEPVGIFVDQRREA